MNKEKTTKRNVLIGLSWVYANGRLHIGHLGSGFPADVLARYHRLAGNDVAFVTGSDCFGTPILVTALNEGLTPTAVAEKYHKLLDQDYKSLDFSFDNYSKTMGDYHQKFVQEFHCEMYKGKHIYAKSADAFYCEKCKKYLPDRYVEGICPHCKQEAKGDSCDHCSKILEPEDLLQPKCKLCGATPVLRATTQLYLKLSALQPALEKFYNERKENWPANAQGLTGRYLNEGLHDRAITRNIEWGIPLPECKLLAGDPELSEKRIYIWAENVLGYLSACKEFCEKTNRNWQDFLLDEEPVPGTVNCTTSSEHLQPPALVSLRNEKKKSAGERNASGCAQFTVPEVNTKLHYYVHAKDNIPFHAIILPGLMLANPAKKYHLPDDFVSSEYVLLNSQKISKSKGNLIAAHELTEVFDSDLIRFYFLRNASDKKDANFTFQDFVNVVNGELINNFGNLVNRTLSFIKTKFDGRLAKHDITEINNEMVTRAYTETAELISQGKINRALLTVLDLVNFGNKLFDSCKPWESVKTDPKKCKRDVFAVTTIIANCAQLLSPFTPKCCAKVLNWLGAPTPAWQPITLGDLKIGETEILFNRLNFAEVKERFTKYV